jgi:hypothetical protein
MPDRSYTPPPDARLPRDDHEWVTKFASQEDISVQAAVDHAVWLLRCWQTEGKNAVTQALETIDLLRCGYQKQVRRRRYFEHAYQMQSRKLDNMRRAYEEQLCRERNIRREYEEQRQRQRDRPEQEEKTTAQSHNEAPYGPTVAKLLALAICSDSDGEAMAAFEKARKLHRLPA